MDAELSVGLFSSTQPNPTHQITDPTQPNPYLTEPLYIEQQLACSKKISLCTSCHHHHPNAHRNNANTHSITSITVILGLFQTDEAVLHQTTSFHKTNLPVDNRHKVTYTCIHDMYFSHICHFRPMIQPNPLKTQIFDPFPTQPNPTQPAGQPNPWTTLGVKPMSMELLYGWAGSSSSKVSN